MLKNLPANEETQVQSLVWEDSLEEEMATHSSILAWAQWFPSLSRLNHPPCIRHIKLAFLIAGSSPRAKVKVIS